MGTVYVVNKMYTCINKCFGWI